LNQAVGFPSEWAGGRISLKARGCGRFSVDD
jgi:hypothetical protein